MVVCGDSMELNRDYESAAIYKWRKKRKKAFVLFICIVGICFLVTRMVRVEDKTTVKVHNMHTEQNEKAIRYVASNMIKEDPKIAITFDDGPSPVWTPQLLDGLKERNVKATLDVYKRQHQSRSWKSCLEISDLKLQVQCRQKSIVIAQKKE